MSAPFSKTPSRQATWAWLGTALLGLLPHLAQAQAQASTWPAPLQQALRQSGVPAEAVSLVVWPVDAPQPRWQHQADVPRQAASVMKLFTTGVALRLGPSLRPMLQEIKRNLRSKRYAA